MHYLWFIYIVIIIAFSLSSCSKKDGKEISYASIEEGLEAGKSILDLIKDFPMEDFYGLEYAGGYIFYIDTVDGSGMVAAPYDLNEENDQFTGAPWRDGDDLGPNFSQLSTAWDSGWINTERIVNRFDGDYFAAKLCSDLDINGYSDWFLPSKDELNEMYINLHINGYGDFNDAAVYWSSSGSANDAWYQFFQTGNQDKFGTLGYFYVRAARNF